MPTNAERKATQARTTAFLDAYKKEIVKEFGSTLVHKISVNENEKTHLEFIEEIMGEAVLKVETKIMTQYLNKVANSAKNIGKTYSQIDMYAIFWTCKRDYLYEKNKEYIKEFHSEKIRVATKSVL